MNTTTHYQKAFQSLKFTMISLLFLLSFESQAQIGIGTKSPKGALDVQSSDQGLIVPRVANLSDVTDGHGNPAVNASIVYVTSTDSFCFRVNNKWFCIEEDSNGNPTLSENIPVQTTGQNENESNNSNKED